MVRGVVMGRGYGAWLGAWLGAWPDEDSKYHNTISLLIYMNLLHLLLKK